MKHMIAAVALAIAFVFAVPTARAESPLTNEDVVKLVHLDLGDEVVVAKIRQASSVDFRLETDDLGRLKKAGVDGKIIAAMLDRSSTGDIGGSGASSAGAAAIAARIAANAGSGDSVRLLDDSGEATPLRSLIGQFSTTYAYVKMVTWLNFPGEHATVRSHDTKPTFLLQSAADPRSRYYIVKLDVNDETHDRSLKVGQGGPFSQRIGNAPDTDWTFDFDAAETHRGAWQLTLRKPLEHGEYGVFSVRGQELFDFGID